MTGAKCDALMDEHGGKFFGMWHWEGWHWRHVGEASCWGDGDEERAFFSELPTGERCNTNWYEGAANGLGWPPASQFTGPAPALFGLERDICPFCAEPLPQWRKDSCFPVEESWEFGNTMAETCCDANENILRILSTKVAWNMCQNLAWLMCAVTGNLPGQDGRKIHFATPPGVLDDRYWDPADSWERAVGVYSVDAVFYAETCIIHRVCKNGGRIFGLKRGEIFECDFDQVGYDEWAAEMIRQG